MNARNGWLPTLSPHARTARHDLDNALAAMAQHHQTPPCHQHPERWFAIDGPTIEWAVAQCDHCPIQRPCATYRDADPTTSAHGIWAGQPDAHQRRNLAKHALEGAA